jgi:hypothetical protein
LIDYLASNGYQINRDENDWNNGSPQKPGLHINDVYNVLHNNGYKDKNLTEGEVSIPLDAIEKLVVKRALKAWTSNTPLGHYQDKEADVQAGEDKMHEAGFAIALTASQTKPNPVVIIGAAWTMAYWSGEWVGGWGEATFPEQEYVYTHRPPKLDPINTPMNSGGDPNNPIFDPKKGAAILIGTLITIDLFKQWDDYLKYSKDKLKQPADNTKVDFPIPTTIRPN